MKGRFFMNMVMAEAHEVSLYVGVGGRELKNMTNVRVAES